MTADPRIDDYIGRSAAFARPVLAELRRRVHAACPEAEEAIKWGMPAFLYKGQILATMAAFKAHASFGLWRGRQVVETGRETEGMGQFGRLATVSDLPPEPELAALLQRAMRLVDEGVKPPARRKSGAKSPLDTPQDLEAALAANPKAFETFQGFSPSARRDYVDWVLEAKQAPTRARRIEQAVEWIAEGKRRNWKYER